MVEPQKKLSAGLLVVLLLCGICPGVIYYLATSKTCPMCNSTNWGVLTETTPTVQQVQPIQQEKINYCPHCGSPVDGAFCGSCGQQVS